MEQKVTAQERQENKLDCLLIPMTDFKLLAPMGAVAEVIKIRNVDPVDGDGPAFLKGWLDWRNQRIPLISLEQMVGKSVDGGWLGSVAVFHTLDSAGKLSFYAMETLGNPSMQRVGEDDSFDASSNSELGDVALLEVNIEGEAAHVPNLEYIEKAVCGALQEEAAYG